MTLPSLPCLHASPRGAADQLLGLVFALRPVTGLQSIETLRYHHEAVHDGCTRSLYSCDPPTRDGGDAGPAGCAGSGRSGLSRGRRPHGHSAHPFAVPLSTETGQERSVPGDLFNRASFGKSAAAALLHQCCTEAAVAPPRGGWGAES